MEKPKWHSKNRFESKESKEVFRASLGFDIIFSEINGTKQAFCVEINGHNSGISNSGLGQKSREERALALTRSHLSEDFYTGNITLNQILEDKTLHPEEKRRLIKELSESENRNLGHKLFKNAFTNDPIIKSITRDKVQADKFIDKDDKPRTYDFDGNEPPCSRSGYILAKPKDGSQGSGIVLMYESYLKANENEPTYQYLKRHSLFQEYLPAMPADMAPDNLKEHPSSLRILVDFVYREDKSVDIVYLSGYQRVGRLGLPKNKDEIRVENIVINMATGAIPVPASAEEMELSKGLILRTINNLGEYMIEQKVSRHSLD